MTTEKEYSHFLRELKSQILQSRYTAAAAVNRGLILLYFQVGMRLSQKIAETEWGSKVIQRLAKDLQQELKGLRGFSYSNIKNMRQFADEYAFLLQNWMPISIGQSATVQIEPIGQSATGQLHDIHYQADMEFMQLATAQFENMEHFLSQVFFRVGFTQHLLLLNKCKKADERLFYMIKSAKNQWTVSLLEHHLASKLYKQKGSLQNNFGRSLPQILQKQAVDAFKGEYLLDFLRIEEEDDERVLENHIVQNIKKFILSLGHDFAFMGNQYRLKVDDEEFFIDLLFYNRKLQSLVAIELKQGKFKAEYAGKMNLYLSALDEYVKQEHENPSIGIVLCKSKSTKVVEFAFRDLNKAMGVATFKTSRELPANYQGVLPNSEQLKRILDDDNT